MGFFDFFSKGLKKTRSNLSMKIDGFSGKLTEDTLEELEEILILSDVSIATAGKICSMLGAKMKKKSIDATQLRAELRDTIVELLSPDVGLDLSGKPT
ncbi:MAG: signal recognition particle receptor subunit alpha, partial [Angelakisella sp.]